MMTKFRRASPGPARTFPRRHSAGFTLVELLVVLSIIAILATLSMPAFRSAMIIAQRTKCSSNLRQIGIALNSYAGDNNEFYPQTGIQIALGGVDSRTHKPSWMEQIDGYDSANHQLFICPAATFTSVNDYFMMAWAAYYANGMQYPTPSVSVLRIKNPSAMILAGDCTFGNAATDADPDDAGASNLPFAGPPFHGKFYNFVFVDGHVESVTAFNTTLMTNRYEGLGYSYNSQSPTPP